MNSDRALDDLRVIRQVMERTRRATGRQGGWFMVLWGAVWFVGFLGNQFLPAENAGILWAVADIAGDIGSIWIAARSRRQQRLSSTIWRPLLFWFISLLVFDGLLIWLFDLQPGRDIAVLILLTIALNFVQIGVFATWKLSLIGLLIAALTVGSVLLFPAYFNLIMAFLGGGLLIVSGFRALRREE